MFQIKFQNGYEIQVIGKGDRGLCRVQNRQHRVVHTGTYDECERWLHNRSVRELWSKNPRRTNKSRWRPASQTKHFHPDRYDFEWNKDHSRFRAHKRAHWSEGAYAKWQSADNPRRRSRRNLWSARKVAAKLRHRKRRTRKNKRAR